MHQRFHLLGAIAVGITISGAISQPTSAKGKSLHHSGIVYGSDHRALCQHLAQIDGVESAQGSDNPPLHEAQINLVLRPKSTRSKALAVAYQVRDYMSRHHHREPDYPHMDVEVSYHLDLAKASSIDRLLNKTRHGGGHLAFVVSAMNTETGEDGNKWHIYPHNGDARDLHPID